MIEPPHRVVVLIRDGIMPLELGIVHQIFGAAEGVDGTKLYSVITCTFAPDAVRTDADFTVQVAHGAEAPAEADTMIVPAAHIADETETEGRLNARLTHAFGLVRLGGAAAPGVPVSLP